MFVMYIGMFVCILKGIASSIFLQALDKAKEAGRKERLLCRQREQAGLGEQISLDLTYCVRLVSVLFIRICTYSTYVHTYVRIYVCTYICTYICTYVHAGP